MGDPGLECIVDSVRVSYGTFDNDIWISTDECYADSIMLE